MIETAHAAPTAIENSLPRSAGVSAAARVSNGPLPSSGALPRLTGISPSSWQQLGERAAEPNGYCLPAWELAVNAYSRGRTNVDALAVFGDATNDGDLIGLMPAISAWRAYGLPLPAFVTADSYPPLGTLLIDSKFADHAASQLMDRARNAGARALILRDIPLDGPNLAAFMRVLDKRGLRPRVLQSHARALLDATRDVDDLLREALGAKKLKELRRQRNRLAEMGEVIYTIASTPAEASAALEVFLTLEASGWKARRGTALLQDEQHLAFIRQAVPDMAARGNCQIVSLYAGATPLAAAVILRHLGRAFYFKLGVEERFAKYSPGVQLTLELTRQMCADPAISSVDSTAIPNHPMIDPIWRDRLAIGDVLIPLYRRDPFVPLMQAALALRRSALVMPRRAVHLIRKIKEQRS